MSQEQQQKLEEKQEHEQAASSQSQLPPKKYRIQTAQDIAGQTKFTTWYIQNLREAYQAEPKVPEVLAAVNLCATFLSGEANLLGIRRTIALFGEELVTACAWEARELHQADRATEVTGRADRTVGGTFFYLLHKWYDTQLEAAAQSQSQPPNPLPVSEAETAPTTPTTNTPAARLIPQVAEPLLPWAQLKIPYLYPKPADCVNPDLAREEPARVFNYIKLREELGRLTSHILLELGTAALTDYAPLPASLSANFAALSSPATELQPTPSQPSQTATLLLPPSPVPEPAVTNPGSAMGQTAEAATEVSAKTKVEAEAETPVVTAATSKPAVQAAEEEEEEEKEEKETNPDQDRTFLRVLANIYGEAAVYGTGKNPNPNPHLKGVRGYDR